MYPIQGNAAPLSATRTARCYAIVRLDETTEAEILLDDNICELLAEAMKQIVLDLPFTAAMTNRI